MAVRAVDMEGAAGGGRSAGGRSRRPLREPPLPEEVLEAPVDGGHLFVDRMEEWRRALGWTHERFAAYLGISRNYWWLLRTYQRELTIGVAQRVLRERREFEHYLAAAVRERRWGHIQEDSVTEAG